LAQINWSDYENDEAFISIKIMKMSEIDFNKLIKDIIGVARGEATANSNGTSPLEENNKLSITLKLEVSISRNSTELYKENQKSSRKLVYLTINEHE
jgi:hypothetical protein